ncbi:DUF5988 family protein [Streptosporangium vulgare]|uniref:DUF5988 family protein n=1 Tax=Streptosporangium vulgare TaxID=46190 RepID=A0ABV5T6B8_9ACTN
MSVSIGSIGSIDQGGQEGAVRERALPGAVPPPLDPAYVEVVLEGGPVDIPRTLRVDAAVFAYGKIKIPRKNGYEHFERPLTPPASGDAISEDDALVFRWTTRTKIAE